MNIPLELPTVDIESGDGRGLDITPCPDGEWVSATFARRLADELVALKKVTCRWSEDGDGCWATQCGGYFQVTEGTPEENEFQFCCYCGGKLVQIPYEEEMEQ